MSRFTFAARKPMMKITMVLGMFPSFMGMIAVYLLMTQFNLINHLWGLILIYAAGAPMGYLTQKGFFDTIPKAIDEAARIDGATNFQVFIFYMAVERFYFTETSAERKGSLHRCSWTDELR